MTKKNSRKSTAINNTRKMDAHLDSLVTEKIMNTMPFNFQQFSMFGLPSINPPAGGQQLSQWDTLFNNLRWYLVSNNRQLLAELYAEIGLIRTICDVPVDDALRGGVEIKTKQLNEDQIDQLLAAIEVDEDLEIAGTAISWNRLFGGAFVLILTDQDPETPLDMDAITEDTPLEFRAGDLWELFWDKQNTEGYNPATQLENVEFYSYYGEKVHHSRVIRIKGLKAPSFIRPRLRGWGLSVVEIMVRSINRSLKGADIEFEVLDEFKVDVYKIKNLINSLMSPNGQEKVRTRVQLGNQIKNYQHALVMDSEDDYDHKQLSFAGLAEIKKEQRIDIAADMRMPITKLFGISAAGFNSGEDDIEVYNGMVESEVRKKVKPTIVKMIKVKCKKMFGVVPDDLKVTFPPLRVLSADQEENVKTQKFNRLMQARAANEITTLEFRERANRSNVFDIPLDTKSDELNPDTLDEPAVEEETPEGGKPAGGKGGAGKPKEAPEAKAGGKAAGGKPQKAPPIKNMRIPIYDDFDGPTIVSVGLVAGEAQSLKAQILTGQRRDNNLWTSPGGHVDEGETEDDAAVREVKEETGITITTDQLRQVSTEIIESHRTGKEFRLCSYLVYLPKQMAATNNDPDNEISVWRWVPLRPETEELKPENRHAKNDTILNYLFKVKNGYDDKLPMEPLKPLSFAERLGLFFNSAVRKVRDDYEKAGGDNWAPKNQIVRVANPGNVDEGKWAKAKKMSVKQYGEVRWPFVTYVYKKMGGTFK